MKKMLMHGYIISQEMKKI